MQCATCKFFDQIVFADGRNDMGHCRRYPPTVQPGLAKDAKTAWFGSADVPCFEALVMTVSLFPVVDDDAGCGEYQCLT